ncbi:hypothetical protein ACFOHW_25625 [Paenibacillus abyssi]|uniref:hypothetical protein n=1 Tax=Paenibacillus abyssi TaxID=1340531 RepID=UPI00361A9A44
METILIILGLLALIVIIAAMSKSRWTTLESARGNQTEDIQTKYAYLQSKDIPSRLRTEAIGPASGFASGSGMSMASGGGGFQNELFKLQVRPKDKERARAVLQEMKKERLLNTPT